MPDTCDSYFVDIGSNVRFRSGESRLDVCGHAAQSVRVGKTVQSHLCNQSSKGKQRAASGPKIIRNRVVSGLPMYAMCHFGHRGFTRSRCRHPTLRWTGLFCEPQLPLSWRLPSAMQLRDESPFGLSSEGIGCCLTNGRRRSRLFARLI
jgi:hypothetical protein